MSFNQKYLEVAQTACDAERLGEWEKAAFYWSLAIELAIGCNRGWAMGRHEYCRNRYKYSLACDGYQHFFKR